jgi:hypothetical protein
MSLNDVLDNDDVDYNIEVELKIRKVLEENTDWNFEFNKNDERYEYDIKFFRWEEDDSGTLQKNHYGYVELERARKWKTGEKPDNWKYYSFLERKVLDYDHRTKSWQDPKDNYERTIYLKFNQLLDNCFAAPVQSIYRDGKRTKRSTGEYNDTYRKLPFSHGDVVEGIQGCVEYIDQFLCNQEGQSKLGEF